MLIASSMFSDWNAVSNFSNNESNDFSPWSSTAVKFYATFSAFSLLLLRVVREWWFLALFLSMPQIEVHICNLLFRDLPGISLSNNGGADLKPYDYF